MKINYFNQTLDAQWDAYEPYLKQILSRTLSEIKHDEAVEVNIILVDDSTIHEYNLSYRNIDRPTDVLSFENGETEDGVFIMGDIIISVDAIQRQALDYGHSNMREFCFLVVHGYLHLLGYDHHTPEEERVMFGLQKEILREIAPKNS